MRLLIIFPTERADKTKCEWFHMKDEGSVHRQALSGREPPSLTLVAPCARMTKMYVINLQSLPVIKPGAVLSV